MLRSRGVAWGLCRVRVRVGIRVKVRVEVKVRVRVRAHERTGTDHQMEQCNWGVRAFPPPRRLVSL